MNDESNETTLVEIEPHYKVGKGKVCHTRVGDKYLVNEYRRAIRRHEEEIRDIKQAIKILDEEKLEKLENLVEKWRLVSQKTISYLHFSTLQKIDKMGGFDRYRERELDQQRKQIEDEVFRYEEEMESFLESSEFQMLNEDDKVEYKAQVEAKMEELEKIKEEKLSKVEAEFEVKDSTFTMKELAKLLKVDYSLIFPD